MQNKYITSVLLIFFIFKVQGQDGNTFSREKYKVIIIGAGVSGLGAATHLLKNNMTDILILEGSNRIGGRVNTAPFGDFLIEYGAQWVHGQGGNAVYKLVQPYNLFVVQNFGGIPNFVTHSESKINLPQAVSIYPEAFGYYDDSESLEACNCSIESYFDARFNNLTKQRNIDKYTAESISDITKKFESSLEGTANLSIVGSWGSEQFGETNGSLTTAWKSGYNSLFKILMSGGKNGEELPVLNKTKFNKVVQNIDWSGNYVDITCEDGSHYYADHVISTVSLGVLKNSANTMFKPPLPERKLSAIQSLGFDLVNKIFIQFETRWWPLNHEYNIHFLWSNEDKAKFRNKSKHGAWATELTGFHFVENQPRVLESWVVGDAARKLEELSNEEVKEGVMDLLRWFLGNYYSISQPINITKSGWGGNKLVRGSYSFRTVQSDYLGYFASDIAQPLPQNNSTPVLLFAGEATHDHFWGTVHGALETGWREANRILSFSQ